MWSQNDCSVMARLALTHCLTSCSASCHDSHSRWPTIPRRSQSLPLRLCIYLPNDSKLVWHVSWPHCDACALNRCLWEHFGDGRQCRVSSDLTESAVVCCEIAANLVALSHIQQLSPCWPGLFQLPQILSIVCVSLHGSWSSWWHILCLVRTEKNSLTPSVGTIGVRP